MVTRSHPKCPQRSLSREYSDSLSSDGSSYHLRQGRRSSCSTRDQSRSPSPYRQRNNRRRKRRQDFANKSKDLSVNEGNNHHEERSAGPSRRIAPNTAALTSLLLGTTRSRDRMDEGERERAKKKLKDLDGVNVMAQQ
ncbi:uncharacterized protein PHALS_07541 [Plasmopara halstedii]|uniref:Uncharacterized protein n=1 Tax=Plasmopara halstedii TaxID=4781 RepID=A0A0P1B5S9_PLAHL|nr:uncharacterized protein PHALS_07541 [Plasmopara halstedii]CEG49797.1 hypothetical protein PHALS_07541 [Plasmopara halstedii]|eukprot:XP_024586166.1 hypothetical protein PHALS_07541 [Plasmopara halstedii]